MQRSRGEWMKRFLLYAGLALVIGGTGGPAFGTGYRNVTVFTPVGAG